MLLLYLSVAVALSQASLDTAHTDAVGASATVCSVWQRQGNAQIERLTAVASVTCRCRSRPCCCSGRR